MESVITVSAAPNIALVKYWGKRIKGDDCRDPNLNLPANSSLSITLDAGKHLQTTTSVVFSKKLKYDAFYLNGEKQNLHDPELKERFIIINKLRKLAKMNSKVLVVSNNSFPTASGLASSASGVSALVFAASKALGLRISQAKTSEITRIGSGSACRSICGGFVKWNRGVKSDGTDSIAKQIFDEKYWPEVIVIIAITSQKKKKISSRTGMRQTVLTSELYKLRPRIAEKNVDNIIKAIKARNFALMSEIIMRDGMMMHATMLDTKPPIIYLNDTSKEIIYAIEKLNEDEKNTIAAYTFDAGPNAFIITLNKNKEKIMRKLKTINGIEKTLLCNIGEGPKILAKKESLIDPETFSPIKSKIKVI